MSFAYITNTKCLINGKSESIRLEDGCTGIGSRLFWLNDCLQDERVILLSEDITKGNHFVYFGYCGARPWDTVYFLVSESKKNFFLERFGENNVYRAPIEMEVRRGDLLRKVTV